MQGSFSGTVSVSHDPEGEEKIGELSIGAGTAWQEYAVPFAPKVGTHALYLTFQGSGCAELKRIAFLKD